LVAEEKGRNDQVVYYQHNRQYMYPEILQAIACNLRNRPEKYSIRAVSNLLGVSKSTIHRWMHLKFKAERKGRTRSLICYEKVIRDYVGLNPNCRLKDIKEFLKERYEKNVSISTICRYLRLLRISYKKTTIQHYTNWDRLIKQRIEFEEKIKNIPKSRFVSLDESYFYRRMIRSYGYSNVGEKCIVKNRVNMKKHSLMLAISMKKVLAYEVESANFNRRNFYTFLKNKLLPVIRNKIIIMDNVSFHRCKEILSLIKRSGNEVLFIPPYSPEYNPIEVVFHMLKSRLCLLIEIGYNDIVRELSLILPHNLKRIFKACLK
jgi:transposase